MDKNRERILVVDDSPDNLFLLQSVLEEGYEVEVASTGREALAIANNTPHPDMILLDVMMPEMNGHQVCQTLKSNPKTRKIPVIFVTGMDHVEDEALGFSLGAVDYISKPISIPTVLARVSTHLALHGQNRRLEQQYQRKNLELIKKNVQLVQEIQERENLEHNLRRLTNHLQTVREDEKAYIAREIHDELGGTLTALKFDTAWVAKKLSAREPDLIDKMNDMARLLDSSVATIRRIVTELRPTIIDDLGLWAAIEWQVDEFRKRTGIKCKTALECRAYKPDQQQAISLFRVIQESLTNVVRHASATQLEVGCKYENRHIRLWIKDNGIGLSKKMSTRPTSHGIQGIYERIESLGGHIDIEGIEGDGTTITIILPTSKRE